MAETIAHVAQLWIYPVKSMAGVATPEAHAGLDGILGDRLYSFVRGDLAAKSTFPWMTAREHAGMLFYRPEYTEPPTPAVPEPALRIRTPEGEVKEPGDAALTEAMSRVYGQTVFLLRSGRGIFDCQHISLFSLASLRGLAAEAGCTIDRRQFRANVYFEPVSGAAYEEEGWNRWLLAVGDEVLLAVTQRDPRCMMINLDPETGHQNPQVLRTVARSHEGQAGIYANIVRPGVMRTGDPIRVVERFA